MRSLRVAGVEEDRVNVSAAVGKSRESKTGIRSTDNPVADTRSDAVLIFAVTESRLGQVDRADRTQQIFVNFLGFV